MQDFSDRTLRHIKRLIRAEGDRTTPSAESGGLAQQVAFVRITGAAVGGYYPGRAELYDAAGAAWDQFGTVWCKAAVGAIDPADATSLLIGLRFDDYNNGGDKRPLFQIVGKATEFTAKEIDGAPSSTTGVQFPNTSLDTSGTDVVLREADPTHSGLMNTSGQTFEGEKSFNQTIYALDGQGDPANPSLVLGNGAKLWLNPAGAGPVDLWLDYIAPATEITNFRINARIRAVELIELGPGSNPALYGNRYFYWDKDDLSNEFSLIGTPIGFGPDYYRIAFGSALGDTRLSVDGQLGITGTDLMSVNTRGGVVVAGSSASSVLDMGEW